MVKEGGEESRRGKDSRWWMSCPGGEHARKKVRPACRNAHACEMDEGKREKEVVG